MNIFPEHIKDIHTHRRECPSRAAILNINPGEPLPPNPSYLSIGVHPWDTDKDNIEQALEEVEHIADNPRIVAIGECGIDMLRGATPERQEAIFERQAMIAEKAGKPLIIHCVRATDRLLRLHRELRPTVAWIVHGFRGKPETAMQLLRAGIFVSLGENFNPATAAALPKGSYFIETDDSDLPAEIIAARIEAARRP